MSLKVFSRFIYSFLGLAIFILLDLHLLLESNQHEEQVSDKVFYLKCNFKNLTLSVTDPVLYVLSLPQKYSIITMVAQTLNV